MKIAERSGHNVLCDITSRVACRSKENDIVLATGCHFLGMSFFAHFATMRRGNLTVDGFIYAWWMAIGRASLKPPELRVSILAHATTRHTSTEINVSQSIAFTRQKSASIPESSGAAKYSFIPWDIKSKPNSSASPSHL